MISATFYMNRIFCCSFIGFIIILKPTSKNDFDPGHNLPEFDLVLKVSFTVHVSQLPNKENICCCKIIEPTRCPSLPI